MLRGTVENGLRPSHARKLPSIVKSGQQSCDQKLRFIASCSGQLQFGKRGTAYMAKKHTAQCACGAIKFAFNTDPTFVAVCHCLDCKKASGGEAATFFGVPDDDFTLISGEPKAFHYTSQSGKGLDRNFCPNCGARVFSSNLEGFPGLIFVQLGSLDDPAGIKPMLEMFTKRRLKWAKPLDLRQFENMPS